MAQNYYAQNLNGDRLYQVYQTRLERVQQYLAAEIDFVRRELTGHERVLELGAGYGRIMRELAPFAASITGIDISADSVGFGRQYLRSCPNCRLQVMDAYTLTIDSEFDVVLCLQNGLSALKGEALTLVEQSMKVLAPGGKGYFSSYSPEFWPQRLAWFKEQADKALLGEIDFDRSKDGRIVCLDGFVATTFLPEDLARLGQSAGYRYRIREVDESSVFLIMEK